MPIRGTVAVAIVPVILSRGGSRWGLVDYILFGAGTGASLAVIGWVLREWGPVLRDGKREDGLIHSASELIDRMSWSRFCASCGMALVFGGTLILLVTAIVAVWNPGDTLAGRILIGTYAAVAILMLAWSGLYTRQFGTSGIYRPAPPKPVAEPAAPEPAVGEAVAATMTDAESAETEDAVVVSQDIESVAASPGGLGRFAAFFKRGTAEPEPPVSDDELTADADDSEEVAEETIVEVDEVEIAELDTESPRIETEETVAAEVDHLTAGEAGDLDVTEENVVESEAQATSEPLDQVVSDAETDQASNGDTASNQAVDREDTPKTEAEGTSGSAEDTPEDTALAELRRRRLARLSGNDSNS